jgi:hypothetical protein
MSFAGARITEQYDVGDFGILRKEQPAFGIPRLGQRL